MIRDFQSCDEHVDERLEGHERSCRETGSIVTDRRRAARSPWRSPSRSTAPHEASKLLKRRCSSLGPGASGQSTGTYVCHGELKPVLGGWVRPIAETGLRTERWQNVAPLGLRAMMSAIDIASTVFRYLLDVLLVTPST